MTRLALFLLLICFGSLAHAAPPYDVDVTLTAPTTGGAVDSYTLVMDGADVGKLTEGANSFPDLITDHAVHVFEARATNQVGETLSDAVEVDSRLPGKATISVTLTFQAQ